MLAGRGRPVVADIVNDSRALGMGQWSAPELPGRSEQSFDGRRRRLLQWVRQRLPEMGGGVCCLLDQLEGTGELLEVR